MEDNEIRFFKRDRELYGGFSNFAQFPIDIYARLISFRTKETFPTVEHFYQASKAINYEDYFKIKTTPTALEAKKLGRKVKLVDNWEDIKYFTLKYGVETKFRTYSHLAKTLLNTGDKRIIEDSPTDFIWGIGSDGTGQNLMGKILEEVRDTLRKEQKIIL